MPTIPILGVSKGQYKHTLDILFLLTKKFFLCSFDDK